MFETLKTWYQKLWDLSFNAGSIVNARLTALSGFVIAVIGALDLSPLYTLFGTSTSFTKEQVISLGVIAIVKGILDEIVRRRNTVVTKSKNLLSKNLNA